MNWNMFLAVFLNTVGYFLYFFQIKKGESNPKLVTWGLWSLLSILNFASYREMTNFIYSLQFFSDAVLCIVIFFYAYFHKNMKVWNKEDSVVALLGILSMIYWWQFKEASFANIIICLCYIVSFYPTIKEVRKNPNTENPVSWYICALAYGFTSYEVYLDEDSQQVDFLSPILLLILHLLVALFAKRRKIFENPINV
jgi:hypothetical protein